MRKTRTGLLHYLAIISFVFVTQISHAEEIELRLGTGAPGAVYDQLGRVIAGIVNESVDSELSIRVVTTDGSVDNLMLMRDGKLDMAIVQNDIAYYVYEGSHGYETFDGFGTGMSLFAEYIQVLVRTDSNIRALGDLEGQTISLGKEGSGSYHNAVDLVTEAGLRPGIDFAAEYLPLEQSLPLLESGSIDAIIVTGAIFPPTSATDPTGIRAVSLSREVVSALALSSPYYVPDKAEVLVDGVTRQISTASVMAFLVISDRVSDPHVQTIAAYLEEQSDRLRAIQTVSLISRRSSRRTRVGRFPCTPE